MERITNAFVRNEFMWDYMSEVNWTLVQQNLDAANRVLRNPAKFPRANFTHLEKKAFELELFMLGAPLTIYRHRKEG